MAITESAKKAHRQSIKRRVFNLRRKRAMKGAVKQIRELIVNKKKEEAQEMLPKVHKTLDKAAKRGVIKQNTASRKKSRLASAVADISS